MPPNSLHSPFRPVSMSDQGNFEPVVEEQKSTSSASPSAVSANQQVDVSTSLLSCELCRVRKVKCDKTVPCATCRRAGVKCVPVNRQRLPRGRNGGRRKADAELKARVGRLENLVKTLESSGKGDSESSETVDELLIKNENQTLSPEKSYAAFGSRPADFGRYIGGAFWCTLSSEVNDLRDLLADPSDDEDYEDNDIEDTTSPAPMTPSTSLSNSTLFLLSNGSFNVDANALQHPPRAIAAALCAEYNYRVNTVIKMVHAPSLKSYLQDGQPYLNYPPGHAAVEALTFAIYFAAVSIQDVDACQANFGQSKVDLIAKYRFATEIALARADLINTTDLAVLQAYLLFLLFSRVNDSSRYTWTLLSVAVRIAQAMGIHTGYCPAGMTPFEQEMRRRVWAALQVIDIQASLDRCTTPLVSEADGNAKFPANINDDDFGPQSQFIPESRIGVTDMSFCCIAQEATTLERQLNMTLPGDYDRAPLEIEQNWEYRREKVLEFQRNVEAKYTVGINLDNPYHSIVLGVEKVIAANIMLQAYRPMLRHPKTTTPKVSSMFILSLAVESLETSSLLQMEMSHPWSWLSSMYPQWHPVAVAAAELCTRTEGALVERAWKILDKAFAAHATRVADSKKGMLWRPIEKLMGKARRTRTKALKQRGMAYVPTTVSHTTFQGVDTFIPEYIPPIPVNQPMMLGQGSDLQMSNMTSEWPQWQLPMTSSGFENSGSLDGSPGTAWQNWESFIDDVRGDNMDFFNMDVDPLTEEFMAANLNFGG